MDAPDSSHVSKHIIKGFIWKTLAKKPICTSSGDYYVPAFNVLAVPSGGTHCCLIKIAGRYFFDGVINSFLQQRHVGRATIR